MVWALVGCCYDQGNVTTDDRRRLARDMGHGEQRLGIYENMQVATGRSARRGGSSRCGNVGNG
jgi:hypothetical protein